MEHLYQAEYSKKNPNVNCLPAVEKLKNLGCLTDYPNNG